MAGLYFVTVKVGCKNLQRRFEQERRYRLGRCMVIKMQRPLELNFIAFQFLDCRHLLLEGRYFQILAQQ
jgi:hypothetical protein